MTLWIVVGIAVAIGLWLIALYNGLVAGRNQTETAWSQIDVQLKRRHDLIPNLVQLVKDAMGYEQETLTKVIQARNAAVSASASGPAQSGPAEAVRLMESRRAALPGEISAIGVSLTDLSRRHRPRRSRPVS